MKKYIRDEVHSNDEGFRIYAEKLAQDLIDSIEKV